MILHGYFQSSASWRVRIGLALKGLPFDQKNYSLLAGEHRSEAYLARNPQGLVPALELDDGAFLTQSLAILEFLEEAHPEPTILPGSASARARIRAAALVIACDIHPLQNLKIMNRVGELAGRGARRGWASGVIEDGLSAFSSLLPDDSGPFCFGEVPTLADICLVPQIANARLFQAEWRYGRIEQIEAACMALPAFHETRPDAQPDA